MSRRHWGTARTALGVSILVVAAIASLAATTVGRAVAAEPEADSNLSVTVTEEPVPTPIATPTASPTPSPTTTPRPSGPPATPPGRDPDRNPGRPPGGDVEQETITDPAEAEEALGDKPSDLGGILALSGLTATVSPTFTPENGSITLSFTVRNTSSTTFNSTARFWITNAVGARIAEEQHVRVNKLEPKETRRISVTFSSLGQFGVLNGFLQFTPPKQVENTQLSTITRDTLIVLPPLFGLSVVAGLGGLGGLLWWGSGARGTRSRLGLEGTPA
ncbi:hypothetical protein [Salinibacterium sp. ZJ450]|uniref:hypothetical protein n=1 Tax=Salinibacterium sp. ZJ450 TaxID=2708338 RepID=UPI00141F9629|nr:hypothetical protein [Salinibacterium sp. ZJ450]